MALRFLLNRGCAAAKHHQTTGLFLTSVSNKTNHQIHQKRDLILPSDGMDDKGICFSNSESPYTFESVSATIKDPYQHGEILDMAKFSVNEHNNNHAEGVEKGNNLRLEYVLEARLGFRWGITEFDITLSALDEGIVNGSSLDTVYKATVSKSRTGDLTLRQFNQFDLPEGMTASPRKKKNREERILKRSENPDVPGEILDVAKFAVNEQNNDNAKRGHKLIQLGKVLEANLKFNSGKSQTFATEFYIKLQTLGRWTEVYEATILKYRTGGLKLSHFSRFREPLPDPLKTMYFLEVK